MNYHILTAQSLKPLLPKMILIRAPNGFVMLKIFSRPIQYSNGFGVPYNIIYTQLWKTTTHKQKITYLGQFPFAKTISIFIPSSIKIFFSVEPSLNNCPCASKIKHTINPLGRACWEAYFESNFRNSRTIVLSPSMMHHDTRKLVVGLGIPDLSCIKRPVRSSISDK